MLTSFRINISRYCLSNGFLLINVYKSNALFKNNSKHTAFTPFLFYTILVKCYRILGFGVKYYCTKAIIS